MAELRDILKSGEINDAVFHETKAPVMTWVGNYEGESSIKGDVKRDGLFTMLAVADTDDRPAPTPVGVPIAVIPNATLIGVDSSSTIQAQHTYVFSKDGIIRSIRLWVAEVGHTITHSLTVTNLTRPDNPTSVIIPLPVLVAGQWNTVAVGSTMAYAGASFIISYTVLNSDNVANIDGVWGMHAKSDTKVPLDGMWVLNKARNRIRIAKIDDNGVDRSAELELMIPSTKLTMVDVPTQNEYQAFLQTTAIIDGGTYYEFEAIETASDNRISNGELTYISMEIPIPEPTQYAVDSNYTTPLPTFLSALTPSLRLDGVEQPVVNTVFGIDFEFQNANVSEDWSIIAFNG